MIYPPLKTTKYLIYPFRGKLRRDIIKLYHLPPFECMILPKETTGTVVELPPPYQRLSSFNMLHIRFSLEGIYKHPLELKHPTKYILGGKCTVCHANVLEQKAFPTCGEYQEIVQKLLLRRQELDLNPISERKI